jgi:hypothetical protein
MGVVETPDPKICYVCKSRTVQENWAMCKECLEKQDYSDVSIGLNHSLMNGEDDE